MPTVTDILAVLKPFADVHRRLEPGAFNPEHTVFYFLGDKPGTQVKHFKAAAEMHDLLVKTDADNKAAAQELIRREGGGAHDLGLTSVNIFEQPIGRNDTPNEPPQPLLERGGDDHG